MGPFGVVESDPLADDLFGLEAVRQVVQVDQEADIAVPALDPRSWGVRQSLVFRIAVLSVRGCRYRAAVDRAIP